MIDPEQIFEDAITFFRNYGLIIVIILFVLVIYVIVSYFTGR